MSAGSMKGPSSGLVAPKRPSAAANGVFTPAGATTVVRIPTRAWPTTKAAASEHSHTHLLCHVLCDLVGSADQGELLHVGRQPGAHPAHVCVTVDRNRGDQEAGGQRFRVTPDLLAALGEYSRLVTDAVLG